MALTTGPRRRENGVDALRTLAVLGMMAAHTSRLIAYDARPEWSRWVLLLEPLIPSLFLFLVGLSLAMSLGSAWDRGVSPAAWYARQLRRAAILWAISAVFFTLELGFRLPDALVTSGILANIAYAIALCGGLLALPKGRLWAGLALFAVAVLFTWLDATGQRVFAVNTGNSPFLPLWLFALAGALWGTTVMGGSHGMGTHGRASLRVLGGILGVAGGLVGVWLIARYGVDSLFTKPFGRSDATRVLAAPLTGGEPLRVAYYNLRPVLAAACLSLHLAALAVFGLVLSRVSEKAARHLFALGRHALGAYILHLAILASLVVAMGEQPLSAGWHGVLVIILVFCACQTWAFFREKKNTLS